MVASTTLVEACPLEQLSADHATLLQFGHYEVGLVLYQGQPVAVVNSCPHFGGPLAQGPVNGARGEIICPWHKFRFALATGQSVTNPDMAAALLPTEVRDGQVFVDVKALTGSEE